MNWFEKLKKNRVFRFVASVQMAVILMVALAVIVAVGTVIESRYNAQIASLLVYRSGWFEALMILLGVNVLASTIVRFPFKKKHIGFVITHVGLLVLLVGSVMTQEYGIDGQLRVMEGQSGNEVAIPELSIKVADLKAGQVKTHIFKRTLEEMTGKQLGFEKLRKETGVVVEKYLPFVTREQSYASDPTATAGGTMVNFALSGEMFGDIREYLHSKDRPDGQLGPTRFMVIEDPAEVDPAGVTPVKGKKPAKKPEISAAAESASQTDRIETVASGPNRNIAADEGSFLVIRGKDGKELKRIAVSELRRKPLTFQGLTISITKVLEQASVVEGKLADLGQKGANPALELQIREGGKTLREFAFAKFPGFSMKGGSGLKFRLDYFIEGVTPESGAAVEVPGHPPVGSGGGAPAMPQAQGGAGAEPAAMAAAQSENRVEFHVTRGAPKDAPVRVEFYKASKKVASKDAKIGEVLDSPWMGMKVKVESVVPNAVPVNHVRPVAVQPRGGMPDSAIFVRAESAPASEGLWLVEGEYRTIRAGDKTYEVYYGVDSVKLPFSVHLDKFEKVDYLGTETPMSFQSTVRVNGTGAPILIKMNEPLKFAGFTLYQSSYELGNGPAASIFSVNQDPGRPVKYLGSLILCLGIIIFSVMKSEWYRKRYGAAADTNEGNT